MQYWQPLALWILACTAWAIRSASSTAMPPATSMCMAECTVSGPIYSARSPWMPRTPSTESPSRRDQIIAARRKP